MKKYLLVFTIFITALQLTACIPIEEHLIKLEESIIREDIEKIESTPHIGFVEGNVNAENEKIIKDASEFSAPLAECSEYRVSLSYDALSENEQIVYNAFEYAMENCYTSILIDDLLITDVNDVIRILSFLSMDSPLVEQNLLYKLGTFTTYQNYEADTFFTHQTEFDGFYITIDNFAQEWWTKKEEALKTAETIINELPDGLSQAETAEQLYLQIAKNTEYAYSETSMNSVQPSLYNTLIDHVSHCDGFTNALSLLYNMAGIKCAEKIYEPEDEKIGHTWNCFEIDGKWYNADATAADLIPDENAEMHAGICFGFTDILQNYPPKYSSVFPQCSDNLHFSIDAHIGSLEEDGFSDTLYNCYKSHDYKWTLILIDSLDKTAIDSKLQNLADRLQEDIRYVVIDCMESRSALLIYDIK